VKCLALLLSVCVTLASACKPKDETTTGETAAGDTGGTELKATATVPVKINDARTDLIFSFIGPDGKYQDVSRIADVPEAARKQVIVTDLGLTPEQRRSTDALIVADLTQPPGADGNRPFRLVSRYPFEKLAHTEARKGWSDAELTQAEAAKTIIMYSASWCGVCQGAKQFLKAQGLPFVERDIEVSERSAAELEAKARKAGVPSTGVPVFDVGGRLMVGFDAGQLVAFAKEAGITPAK
jgi:glutaredoxin